MTGPDDQQRTATSRERAAARAAARRQAATPSGAWNAWFDGSARPNPGRCAIGAVLRGPGGVAIEIARPAGDGDSSDAEYRALIAVLDAALAHGATGLLVRGDSRVVIDDVNGPDHKASTLLSEYRSQARARLAALPGARLAWVPRHRNGEADALSQRGFAAATQAADA